LLKDDVDFLAKSQLSVLSRLAVLFYDELTPLYVVVLFLSVYVLMLCHAAFIAK